jgi:YVTN family beta-propeller protein
MIKPPFLGLLIVGLASLTLISSCPAYAQGPNPLNNGKSITPPPDAVHQDVGSLPINMVLTPDGKYAITTDMGFRESVWCIDAATGRGVDHIVFDIHDSQSLNKSLYYGLAAYRDPADGTTTVYAGTGSDNKVAVINVASDGKLSMQASIPCKAGDFTAGVALDSEKHLYVVNNEFYPASSASRGGAEAGMLLNPGSLVIYDLKAKPSAAEIARVALSKSFGPLMGSMEFRPTTFPFAVAALSDGTKAYVTSQRDGDVYVVDVPLAKVVRTLSSGSHPVALLLDKSQRHLFVANAHSDTVSIFNTVDDSLAGTLVLRPTDAEGLPGATPTSMAFSSNEKTLYVSLGDMNAVAVASIADLSRPRLEGYIPAGWYPSAVVVTREDNLLVANAKGTKTRNPTPGYSLNLIEGNVLRLHIPDAAGLKADTAQVLRNNSISTLAARPSSIASKIGIRTGKITHVIYIIKENRTYDQVLGDEPRGNGVANMAIFGQRVTPNEHAIERRFVLFDNFFDCGSASGEGWPWSTSSMANEYVIKNLPYNYSGRGRNYDFEGQNNGYPAGGFAATDPDGKTNSIAFPNGAPAIPDVSDIPTGHIWDAVHAAGLTYRNYGFFLTFGVRGLIPDNYPGATGLREAGHDLAGHSDVDFRRFDLNYPDSDAPSIAGHDYPTKTYGKHNASSRFDEFKNEFDQMMSSSKGVPAFMMVRLMSDHTSGMASGKPTTRSHVADNDYGVGQLVDLVSHSKIWNHTAIFVIEDDAQDGPDHVDCHRSTCYVISPYIHKASVDHSFYNTDSVLRTIEDLLGVRPLSQYDAFAPSIADFDATPTNDAPYNVIAEDSAIVNGRNADAAQLPAHSALGHLVRLSDKMDFVHPDSAPDNVLNSIVWQSVRGVGTVMPTPRHNLEMAQITGKKKADADSAADPDGDGL